MGGNVAWTIRRSDGTEWRMDRWTNIFPEIVWRQGFTEESPEAVEAALEQWKLMAADYEANKETGNFAHAMTGVYAPYPYGLRPSEYGVIVTDFKTRTMISCQHYTALNECVAFGGDVPTALLDLIETLEGRTGMRGARRYMDAFLSKPDLLGEALAQGRIQKLECIHDGTTATTLDVVGWSARRIQEAVAASAKAGIHGFRLTLDLHGWAVHEIDNGSAQNRRRCLDEILALGFELDEGERSDFERWIKEAEVEHEA